MKKFKVQISEVLLYSKEDAAKSKAIAAELKEMEKKAPGIKRQSEEAKENYWLAYQALQKSIILNAPLSERKRLQANVWQAESDVRSPLKAQGEAWQAKSSEAEALTIELRQDIYGHVQHYIQAALDLKKAIPAGSDKRWVTRGEWDGDIKVHTIKSNFAQVDSIVSLLQEFRGLILSGGKPKLCKDNVAGMPRLSHDEIVNQVKIFEAQINKIDIFQQVAEEIRPTQFADLRAANLI